MHFTDSFLPLSGSVGLLAMLTYYFIIFACYAFIGNFVFGWLSKSSVAPEHRVSRHFSAIIAVVAGISYALIAHFYHEYLRQLSETAEAQRSHLTRVAYNAIGQLRYIDWGITTPLLLLKMVTLLRIQPHQAKSAIFWLLFADLFMIVTGYIGEQQLDATGEIIASSKLAWGAVSTVGYIIIPIILYGFWKRFGNGVQPEERKAYKWLALSTVTTWGVYPIGYIVSTFKNVNPNYIHIAFSIADVINKVGAAVVVYLASKKLLEKRLPEEAVMSGHIVG